MTLLKQAKSLVLNFTNKGDIMIKKIATTLLLTFAGLQAQTPPPEMKYFININKDFKGILHFENSKKQTDIKYYNITSRDKIPFYAPTKEFSFTSLNKQPTLKSLIVGNKNKHMVYNLASLSEDAIEEADINAEDIASSAIIYNADDLPSEVLEKKLIHTIESLMLSIYETKKIPKGAFYLYEPHKKMLIKVAFKKEGHERLKIGSKTCSTETDVLEIAGRNKRLIRVYTNGAPLKVESYSKKWSFVIAGVGKTKKVRISNKEIAFKVFKDEVIDKYGDYNVKILSQTVETDMFDKIYMTKFHVSKKLTDKQLKKYLQKYTKNNRRMEYATSKKDAYVFKVSNSDVMDLLEKKYEIEDDKYYWKESRKVIDLNKLLQFNNQAKDEDSDYEDLLETYLHTKYKDFKISDFKESENAMGKVTKLKYTLSALYPIDNDLLYSFAVKAMQKEYPKNKFTNRLEFVKSKKSWKLYISKSAVQNSACAKVIPLIKSKYKDGMCQQTAQSKHTSDDTKGILASFIARHYKDLDILNTEINYGNDSVSFDYLGDLTKVQNGCK